MSRLRALLITMGILLPLGAFAQYMSKEEVLNEYERVQNQPQELLDVPLTEVEEQRAANLIPMKQFVDEIKRHKKENNFKYTASFVTKTPSSVDWRSRDTSVKSQDNGKCSSYSLVAGLENLMQRNGKIVGLDLSEWHHWSHYKKYSTEASISAAQKNYICNEKDYPQYGKQSSNCTKKQYVKLTGVNYFGDDTNEMKAALSRGNVVNIAMSTPNSMLKCDKVISSTTTNSGGGHALLLSGYYTSGTETLAIIKNSWGTGCGNLGYQYMPMSLCKKSGFYCDMYELSAVEVKGNR